MLPAFNANGDLPAGIHLTDWLELQDRFGRGITRLHALARLRRIHDLARRTGALRKFYVFGSFVSSAPMPRDVDVVLVMASGFRLEDAPMDSQPLFSHLDAEVLHRASIFWLREGMLSEESMRDLLLAWQTRRDGMLRGILEVG